MSTRTGPVMTALEFVDVLVDEGSFVSWDSRPDFTNVAGEYYEDLVAAEARSGADEAAVTGEALIDGQRIALIVSEFNFLGGSIGIRTAARIAATFRRAAREGLPVIASPASGGTRMQEGTPAFLAMVDIASAVDDLLVAGGLYVVYLRHPTTGGVMASWASMGHITAAEPGALVGFLGPRVYKALHGNDFPTGIQTSENLHLHGLLDAVVDAPGLKDIVSRAISVLSPEPQNAFRHRGTSVASTPDAWDAVLATRERARPRLDGLLRSGAQQLVELNGSGEGHREAGVRLALVKFGATPCVLIGQTGSAHQPFGPASLRVARRGLRLGAQLRIPVVTLIDTPGATLSAEAEETGLSAQISRCLHEMLTVNVPRVSVLLGQGTGGAAIALLPADRTVAAANAWFSPLPPEGASVILYRTPDRGPDIARVQGIRAHDLYELGVVDQVVEDVDADGSDGFIQRIAQAIEGQLIDLRADREGLLGRRKARYGRYAELLVE